MSEATWQGWLDASRQVLGDAADAFPEAMVERAAAVVAEAIAARRPVLVCGNGGSAADSLHFAAELVGRFKRDRQPYRVMSLAADPTFLTAWSNDASFEDVFARQVQAHGEAGGVLIGLTTSGRSPNVLQAFQAARRLGMTTIALTGERGRSLQDQVDIVFAVPTPDTALAQQVHLVLYHHLCRVIEDKVG